METQPLQPGPEPVQSTGTLGPTTEKTLLAPIWHTVLIIALLVTASYLGSPAASSAPPALSHPASQKLLIAQYVETMMLEVFMLFLVWVGIRLKRVPLRELIGGRWQSPEDFLIDVGIALGFWVVSLIVLGALGYLLGLASPSQAKEAQKLANMLAPQGWGTLVIWILLSSVAGFVEEIVFRGYLQRQLGLITGNIYVGLVMSAILFGGAHGYEGVRRMVLIAVYGVMFGILTLWRRSLRPGMIAHAWHDAFEGILLRFLSRNPGLLGK